MGVTVDAAVRLRITRLPVSVGVGVIDPPDALPRGAVSLTTAAAQALRDAGRPMSAREIWSVIQHRVTSRSKKPIKSLRSSMWADARFERPVPKSGIFRLAPDK